MDSDDSSPGSSVSNSSSNSSENSRSSPEPSNEPETAIELNMKPTEEIEECEISRPNSRCSNDGDNTPHSSSKSDFNSSSSSTSSDNENDGIKSPMENPSSKRSRTTSPQPTKSQRSSRHSSLSSNHSSRSNSVNSDFRNEGADISHEDLSDVSEMESEKRGSIVNTSKQSIEDEATNASATSAHLDQENDPNEKSSVRRYSLETDNSQNAVITDLRQKLDQIKTLGKTTDVTKEPADISSTNETEKQGDPIEDLVKPNDEDALDFEAEEGECQDISKDEDKLENDEQGKTSKENEKAKCEGEVEEGEELEEGEVTDEDEKRPEETEPKPVCRFYTRGQCTWGMSCRFLHPGVTDKGNYTMFDLVRPVPVTQTGPVATRPPNFPAHPIDFHEFRTERPVLHHRLGLPPAPSVFGAHHDPRAVVADGPVVIESAWERGLRTAKEMMRKANKRKEQDMDFEDKKMNLTLSPDEIEKDAYYLKERASPQDIPPPYARHPLYQEPVGMYSPTERFARGPPLPSPYDDIDSYGRTSRYRELPPHRMPQYEDERRVRPTREVIVQRVEPVGRGDEWRDPWMRSPGVRGDSRGHSGKRRHDRRSYSSNSSYSSSSSSRSDSSSESTGSSTPAGHRRRYNSSHKTSPARRHGIRSVRSPSLPRRRHSPSGRHSPAIKRKGTVSPTMDKRAGYSPTHKRKKLSSTAKRMDKPKSRHRVSSSSSGSGSSDSSDSDSDSGSSSSDSSSISRERASRKRSRTTETHERRSAKKAEVTKKRSPISIEIKKQPTVGVSALASSPSHSINSDKDTKKSRREELLKQLRAVEDAIAKKRSKLN